MALWSHRVTTIRLAMPEGMGLRVRKTRFLTGRVERMKSLERQRELEQAIRSVHLRSRGPSMR